MKCSYEGFTHIQQIEGDLYYALTHSPAPLTEEDAYALSWKAATERLELAGSIPVTEAEMMQEALSSNAGGIEVSSLPYSDDFLSCLLPFL